MKTLLSVLFVLCVSFTGRGEIPDAIKKYVDSTAAAINSKGESRALAIGVVIGGKTQLFTYGFSEKEKKLACDSLTRFAIGPLSGTLTDVLFSLMTIDGEVRYDAPLQKFLPVQVPVPVYQETVCEPLKLTDEGHREDNPKFTPFICVPAPGSKPQPILLCYLASHTSGLPDLPVGADRYPGKRDVLHDWDDTRLYGSLQSLELSKPIGYDYRSSAMGMSLLSLALQRKSGLDAATLYGGKLFRPLEMMHTELDQVTGLSPGFSSNGTLIKPVSLGVFSPALGMSSTPGDMLRFLESNILRKNDLIHQALEYSHNPRVRLSGKQVKREVALGWFVDSQEGDGQVVWQGGTAQGHSCFIGFNETSHTGVMILSGKEFYVHDVGVPMVQFLNAVIK